MTQPSILLFVDDERPSPGPEWTVARSFYDALSYFEDESGYSIEAMSLDWYMGTNEPSGLDIAKEMVVRAEFLTLPIFQNTQTIWLHSSDRSMACEQASILVDAQKRGVINSGCKIRLNTNMRSHPRI